MVDADTVDAEAVALFGRLGPLTEARRVSFDRLPSDADWEAALGHQGIVRVGPSAAARVVRRDWTTASD